VPQSVGSVDGGSEMIPSSAAADALGMTACHLTRCCAEGRVAGVTVNGQLFVASDEIDRIQNEQGRARVAAVTVASSASDRLRRRVRSRLGEPCD
jgi:hypothetical protein